MPVLDPERVAAAKARPYGELMEFFEGEFPGAVQLDGSKHPAWLRSVLADRPADRELTVAFLAVRSPFAFCDSHRFRSGRPTWQAANIWRDVYYDALRLLTRAGLPFMVVRYEDFALDPDAVLRPACRFLGVPHDPAMRFFQGHPRHDIGGNHSVHAVPPEEATAFPTGSFRERLPDYVGGSPETAGEYWDYWGKPFGGWVDDKWQRRLTAGDLDQVLQTPGLADLANLLGYQLSADVAAWSRRQCAD